MDVPRKYGLLRAIAFILKLLAWLILLAGIAGLVLGLLFAGQLSEIQQALGIAAIAGAIAAPLLGVIWFVQLFAFGSILSLMIDIEEDTRALVATSS